MRVLILGAYGMLGHKMYQVLSEHFDVFATARKASDSAAHSSLFEEERLIIGLDVLDIAEVEKTIETLQPDAVINCVGIIKQLSEASNPVLSIATNSLLPHQLSAICGKVGARLIHISTDCVFSGDKGGYKEAEAPDPIDLYGRTKWLGEVVDDPHTLTIRTSIIGRELAGTHALVEWFLSQTGKTVSGFTNAIFSGLPTISLAKVVASVLKDHPDLHGLYQVSAEPIDKFQLLNLIRDAYSLPIEIVPSSELHIDRSLDSTQFRNEVGWSPPAWPQLIQEMASDMTPYEKLRSSSH